MYDGLDDPRAAANEIVEVRRRLTEILEKLDEDQESEIRKALDELASQSTIPFLDSSKSAYYRGHLRSAIEWMRLAAEVSPDDADIQMVLSGLEQRVSHSSHASKLSFVLRRRAREFADAGRFEEALRSLEPACSPGNHLANTLAA